MDPQRAKTADILKRKIERRPDRQVLINRRILRESKNGASPYIQEKCNALQKQQLRGALKSKLEQRPGCLELVEKGVLQVAPALDTLIKRGNFSFPRVSSSGFSKLSAVPENASFSPSNLSDASPLPKASNTRPQTKAPSRSLKDETVISRHGPLVFHNYRPNLSSSSSPSLVNNSNLPSEIRMQRAREMQHAEYLQLQDADQARRQVSQEIRQLNGKCPVTLKHVTPSSSSENVSSSWQNPSPSPVVATAGQRNAIISSNRSGSSTFLNVTNPPAAIIEWAVISNDISFQLPNCHMIAPPQPPGTVILQQSNNGCQSNFDSTDTGADLPALQTVNLDTPDLLALQPTVFPTATILKWDQSTGAFISGISGGNAPNGANTSSPTTHALAQASDVTDVGNSVSMTDVSGMTHHVTVMQNPDGGQFFLASALNDLQSTCSVAPLPAPSPPSPSLQPTHLNPKVTSQSQTGQNGSLSVAYLPGQSTKYAMNLTTLGGNAVYPRQQPPQRTATSSANSSPHHQNHQLTHHASEPQVGRSAAFLYPSAETSCCDAICHCGGGGVELACNSPTHSVASEPSPTITTLSETVVRNRGIVCELPSVRSHSHKVPSLHDIEQVWLEIRQLSDAIKEEQSKSADSFASGLGELGSDDLVADSASPASSRLATLRSLRKQRSALARMLIRERLDALTSEDDAGVTERHRHHFPSASTSPHSHFGACAPAISKTPSYSNIALAPGNGSDLEFQLLLSCLSRLSESYPDRQRQRVHSVTTGPPFSCQSQSCYGSSSGSSLDPPSFASPLSTAAGTGAAPGTAKSDCSESAGIIHNSASSIRGDHDGFVYRFQSQQVPATLSSRNSSGAAQRLAGTSCWNNRYSTILPASNSFLSGLVQAKHVSINTRVDNLMCTFPDHTGDSSLAGVTAVAGFDIASQRAGNHSVPANLHLESQTYEEKSMATSPGYMVTRNRLYQTDSTQDLAVFADAASVDANLFSDDFQLQASDRDKFHLELSPKSASPQSRVQQSPMPGLYDEGNNGSQAGYVGMDFTFDSPAFQEQCAEFVSSFIPPSILVGESGLDEHETLDLPDSVDSLQYQCQTPEFEKPLPLFTNDSSGQKLGAFLDSMMDVI